MQLALEFFTAFGSLAIVALSIFLLSGAQRRICAPVLRNSMEGKDPLDWFSNGFLNTIASCDGKSTASTVFGYAHSRMMPQEGVLYSLMGISVAPLTFFAMIFFILSGMQYFYLAFPLIGIGYIASLSLVRLKNASRIVMALGMLIFAMFVTSNSISSILTNYIDTQELFSITNTHIFSLVAGIGIGTIGSLILGSPYILGVLALILYSSGAFGMDFILGMLVGSVGGEIFVLVPMASRGGTVVMRAFMHYSFGFFIALILFCTAYYFLPISYKMSGGAISVLVFLTTFLLAFLPIGIYVSRIFNKVIAFFIPNTPKDGSHLVILSNRHRPDSTLSLLQVQKEIVNHTRRTYKMLSFLRDVINEEQHDSNKVKALYERIEKYKNITDNVEQEIVSYICDVALGDISRRNTHQMRESIVSMGKVTHIADIILNTSQLVRKGFEQEHVWDKQQLEIIGRSVQQLQLVQYGVISVMDGATDNNAERVKADYEELKHIVESANERFYLYNQVLMIETLSEIKNIAKLLSNLLK